LQQAQQALQALQLQKIATAQQRSSTRILRLEGSFMDPCLNNLNIE
jgi:hypothetical protein